MTAAPFTHSARCH